jgi:hypothetical protein
MREHNAPHIILETLYGPGNSGGNTLWTYAVVLDGDYSGAIEVEVDPVTSELVLVREVMGGRINGNFLARARLRGIAIP